MMKIISQTKPLNIRQFRIIYVIWVALTLTSCNNELKTDFEISYKTYILLPLFKSDSIHIVFDGLATQLGDFYKSIIITGNDTKYLEDAIAFQKFMIANTTD